MKDIRKELRDKLMRQKWDALQKRGIKPPKDAEENRKRAKEAHGY